MLRLCLFCTVEFLSSLAAPWRERVTSVEIEFNLVCECWNGLCNDKSGKSGSRPIITSQQIAVICMH